MHYARGGLGLLALIAAVIGAAVGAPAALALLIVRLARAPYRWAIGLVQTREREACADGHCAARS